MDKTIEITDRWLQEMAQLADAASKDLRVGVIVSRDDPDGVGWACVVPKDHPTGRLPEGVPCTTIAKCGLENDPQSVADAMFFASSRSAVPLLIEEVRRLRKAAAKEELTALVGEPLHRWPTMEVIHAGNIANIICSCAEISLGECVTEMFVEIYLEKIKDIPKEGLTK